MNVEIPSVRSRPRALAHPGARILLGEDDPEMRRMLAGALRNDGYNVVDVADGGEVLMRLASGHAAGRASAGYALVLCDVRMPVCTGLQVLESIRSARWSTPVILITAFGEVALHERIDEQGGVCFDKPFDVDDLRTAVAHMLRAEPESDEPREQPILARVASPPTSLDAWAMKWALEADGIRSFLGGQTDVYVFHADVERGRRVIERDFSD